MNRSLTSRLNAMEQKFTEREPNAIVLAIRAILGRAGAKFSEGKSPSELEISRRVAIDALKRWDSTPTLTEGLLHLLNQPPIFKDQAGEHTDAPENKEAAQIR